MPKIKSSNIDTSANLVLTSVLTVSNNATFSGNVGIGTSSPKEKAEINGGLRVYGRYNESTTDPGVFIGITDNSAANTADDSPRVGFFNGNTAQNWQIDNYGGNFRWFTPGQERMRIDTNGNVGIGNTSPAEKLHVDGLIMSRNSSLGAGLKIINTSANREYRVLVKDAGYFTITDETRSAELISISNTGITQLNGELRIKTNVWHADTDGNVRFYFGGNARSYYRAVDGHEFRNNSDNTIAIFGNDNKTTWTGGGAIYNNTGFQYKDHYTGHLAYSRKSGTPYAFYWRRSDTGAGDGANLITQHAMYDNTFEWYVNNGGTLAFIIQSDSGLRSPALWTLGGVSGAALYTDSSGNIRKFSSSLKYKRDIEDLSYSYVSNAIDNLRPVWYKAKTEALGPSDIADWSWFGLIAEEVHEVEPRLVVYTTTENKMVKVPMLDEQGEPVLDSDGNPQYEYKNETAFLDTPTPESVDYARLSVLLLAEVKELKRQVSELKSLITPQ